MLWSKWEESRLRAASGTILGLQPTDTILTTTQHYWREQCMPSIHACLALGLISSNVHSISASGRCSNNWKTLQFYNSLYWFCSVLQGCDVLLDRHYYYDLASTNSMVLETSWNQNIHHVPRLFVFGPSSTHTPHYLPNTHKSSMAFLFSWCWSI